MTEATLWDAVRIEGDTTARDELLLRHMGLVHHVARQVGRTASAETSLDELVSAGTLGLMNAISAFDPSRGLAFSTFAAHHIRGAVLDDLRRRDHLPRSVRKKQRDIARARERLSAELGRAPTDRELAVELGVDVERLWRWQAQVERAARVSLDHPLDGPDGEGAVRGDVLAGEDGRSVEERLNRAEEVRILRDAILELKEQERIVVSLYYFEDLKLHEIASVLGVTESRVSQIRSKAIRNLRGRLGHLVPA